MLKNGLQTYSRKELTGYLVGLAGQNIIYNITAAALMFYFQSVIFLPAMAYSTIVAIARVWDAINDPMMGNIVDKTRTKWGKCKPYLLFVPAVVLVTTILPFFNMQYSAHTQTVVNTETVMLTLVSDKEAVADGFAEYYVDESGNKYFWNNEMEKFTTESGEFAISKLSEVKNHVFDAENGVYSFDIVEYEATSMGKKVLIVGWAGFSYILWGMSYTAGDIPLWGVTSLMTEDEKDRSKILALARIVASAGAIGMLVQFIAPSLKGTVGSLFHIEDDATQLQYSFIILAVVLTLLASVMFQFAGLSVKEKVKPRTEKTYTMKENFATRWSCKPFRQLLVSGILRSPIQLLSTSALTLVIYYYFDNDPGRALGGENGPNIGLIVKVAIIAIGIFGGMLVASAVTPALAEKYEKKTLYNFYSVVGALPFGLVLALYAIFREKLITSLAASVIMGIVFFAASWAMGGLNVLQSVMIADCVDYEEYHHGVRPDGVFFSGQSFITKLSAGIATIIQGVVFSAVHWSDDIIKAANDALAAGTASFAIDYEKFAFAMFFLVSIPPMIGLLLSALPTLKYEISNAKHKEMLTALVANRKTEEAAE